MAGDWIKMRVLLARDPAVIRMADFLAVQREFMNWLTDPVQRTCDKTAYEHVTCNVISALCVTGLLVTWGVARDRGERVDDDLVLDKCTLATLTEVSGIPCFGEAMAEVSWAVEDDPDRVLFPKYFKENESPQDRYRKGNAERQARFRDKRNVTRNAKSNGSGNGQHNVTVTHREEKRRVNPVVPFRFAKFWSAYPLKTAKAAASRAFAKINPDDVLLASILVAVDRQAKSEQWTRDGGQFIPHAATWLNGKRWEDEAPLVEARRVAI